MSVHSLKLVIVSTFFISIAALALLGQSPASAALAPMGIDMASNPSIASSGLVTTTAVLTNSQVVTPTATKVVTPAVQSTATNTSAPATATKTNAATATLTKTQVINTPISVIVTSTKVITVPTATKTLAATPTKTLTATVTRTPTSAPRARAAGAGTVITPSTAFMVQNLDPSANGTIIATFYDSTGGTVGSGVTCSNILPGRSCLVDQRVSGGGLDGLTSWRGSVVMSSTTQVGAVVLEYGGTSSSGTGFRMDAYTGTSGAAAATSILLPQLIKNIWSDLYQITYYSTFSIQNTSATQTANVSLTYTNPYIALPNTSTHSGITIPPGASVFIDMTNEVSAWSTFNGPARLTSDQPVTVVVNSNAPGVLGAYVGYTSADASTTLIVPQAVTNIGPMLWSSAITGMTVDGSSSTYTVTYSNNSTGAQKTCSLTSGPSFSIDFRPQYWPSCSPPADGSGQFYGTVLITGSTPLVASVNTQAGNIANGLRGAVAFAFPSTGGTTTGFAPLISNAYLDVPSNLTYGTGIAGRMDGTGTVQINYYLSGGQVYTDTYTVAADHMFTFDQRFPNSQTGFTLPSGSIGSAKITAPWPMVFKVNINGDLTKFGDLVGSYRGINQ